MKPPLEKIPTFREVQRLGQTWIWVLVLAAAAPVWYMSVRQLLLRRPLGERPIPDIAWVVLWIILGVGLPALFLFCKLVTEVHADGIYIRYYPFHSRFHKIAFSELIKYEVRDYRPILEYGGWGIRIGSKGKAYNMSGNRGVQLELAHGRRLLIGSQRPEELWQAIQTAAGALARSAV